MFNNLTKNIMKKINIDNNNFLDAYILILIKKCSLLFLNKGSLCTLYIPMFVMKRSTST